MNNSTCKAALFDLSDRSKIHLTGPEAVSFLHNLCTNNIKCLSPGGGCETFLTTAKARIVAHGFVSFLQEDGEDVLVFDSVPGSADAIVKHLDHYLISEQVLIEDHTSEIAMIHICGPQARWVLEEASGSTTDELDPLHHVELTFPPSIVCRARRNDYLGSSGYDLFFTGDALAVQDLLAVAGAEVVQPNAYDILRVEAGFPVFGKDMDEDRLAMEAGRTANAISYEKGCYLGQETIVMARDRGHANRTLLGLQIKGNDIVQIGSKVYHDGKAAGQTASSVISPRFGAIALVYLQRGSQAPGTEVEVETTTGPRKAVVTCLPFSEDPWPNGCTPRR